MRDISLTKLQKTGLQSKARTHFPTVHVNQPTNVTYIETIFFGDSEEKKPEKKRNNSIQQKLEATHAVSAKSSEQGGSGPWARAVDPRETGHMLANTKILKPATGGTTPILFA